MHPKIDTLSARPVSLTNLQWLNSSCILTSHVMPEAFQQWLLDNGSLTARLKKEYHNEFYVEVLLQEWQKPHPEESLFLLQPHHQEANIREVLLVCSHTPVVFARTVIPASSLEGENRQLLYLNDKPLGELMFSQPGLARSTIEVTRTVDTNHRTVWGRRSIFTLNNKPLAVSEFFLPALFDRQPFVRPAGAISE